MPDSDDSPWKPPRDGEQSSGPPPLGGPPRAGEATPPPTGDARQGPWRTPGNNHAGPWRAPEGQPAGARPQQSDPLKTNVLGAISLVLALVGIGMSLYPPIMHFGWFALAIALALGVVGLFPSGMTKGLAIAGIVTSVIGAIIAVIVTLVVAGAMLLSLYGFTTAPSPTSAPSSDTGASSSESTRLGSRDNPAAIGQPVARGEWEIVVNSFTRDATDSIMNENEYNVPPPSGRQHAMANITITYTGVDRGIADLTTLNYIAEDGTVADSREFYLVVPDQLGGEVLREGSATGNVPVTVPTSDDDGLLRVTASDTEATVHVKPN